MIKIQRVLFPTDFSPTSERAFLYAAQIARTHEADLHLFHVNVLHEDDPWGSVPPSADFESLRTLREGWGAEKLSLLAGKRELDGLTVFQRVVWDISAARAIAHHAAEEALDLVVMGTHGIRGITKWLLGSVAAEVVRTAHCSVLTVPPRGDPPEKPTFRKILAPVDFSKCSRDGLSVASQLALGYGAQLELLHVAGNHTGPGFQRSRTAGSRDASVGAPTHDEAGLRWFLKDVTGRTEIPAGFNLSTGHPGQEIPRFAEVEQCDLIVISSLGLTGIDRFMLGSTSERVISGAHCPVLVVRAPGRSLIA